MKTTIFVTLQFFALICLAAAAGNFVFGWRFPQAAIETQDTQGFKIYAASKAAKDLVEGELVFNEVLKVELTNLTPDGDAYETSVELPFGDYELYATSFNAKTESAPSNRVALTYDPDPATPPLDFQRINIQANVDDNGDVSFRIVSVVRRTE